MDSYHLEISKVISFYFVDAGHYLKKLVMKKNQSQRCKKTQIQVYLIMEVWTSPMQKKNSWCGQTSG